MKYGKLISGLKILAIEAAMVLALTACELPIGDGDGNGGGGRPDTTDNRTYKYNGLLSEFALDVDDDRAMDITVTHELLEQNEVFYQVFYFENDKDISFLAHGMERVTGVDRFDMNVLASIEKDTEIKRGLEQILYPVDFYYGNKLLVTGMPINSDATVVRRLNGPITENKGYLDLTQLKEDGLHFGWIEYEINPDPVDLVVTMIYPPQGLQVDAEFKVKDFYINPEANEYIRAGHKRLD